MSEAFAVEIEARRRWRSRAYFKETQQRDSAARIAQALSILLLQSTSAMVRGAVKESKRRRPPPHAGASRSVDGLSPAARHFRGV